MNNLVQAQFITAFCQKHPEYLPLWSELSSKSLIALVDFRSSVHRWMATGQIPEQELAVEVERLSEANLTGLVDTLMATAVH